MCAVYVIGGAQLCFIKQNEYDRIEKSYKLDTAQKNRVSQKCAETETVNDITYLYPVHAIKTH